MQKLMKKGHKRPEMRQNTNNIDADLDANSLENISQPGRGIEPGT